MTATNHALTGAIIGLTIGNPLVAIPIAFISHFVLDALPHYGPAREDIASSSFRNYLILDACLCILLVLILSLMRPDNWVLGSVCAFTAASPDMMWLPDFLRARKGEPKRNINRRGSIVRLHAMVQWYQKPLGAVTEVVWFVTGSTLLSWLVR